jgi:hypothetical protein
LKLEPTLGYSRYGTQLESKAIFMQLPLLYKATIKGTHFSLGPHIKYLNFFEVSDKETTYATSYNLNNNFAYGFKFMYEMMEGMDLYISYEKVLFPLKVNTSTYYIENELNQEYLGFGIRLSTVNN